MKPILKCIKGSMWLLLIVCLCGCSAKPLAACYDEAVVTEKAHQLIEVINQKDYERVNQAIREDLQEQFLHRH